MMPEPTVELMLHEYIFFAQDPERMTRRIREVKKPCLAFKILGAGRYCQNAQALENAFSFAFRRIKPSDGVIVGMYPALSGEAKQDAELVRKCGIAEHSSEAYAIYQPPETATVRRREWEAGVSV